MKIRKACIIIRKVLRLVLLLIFSLSISFDFYLLSFARPFDLAGSNITNAKNRENERFFLKF